MNVFPLGSQHKIPYDPRIIVAIEKFIVLGGELIDIALDVGFCPGAIRIGEMVVDGFALMHVY